MPLTDSQFRSFKATSKGIRKSDGGGLFLDVLPASRKVFRFASRSNGGQRKALIGTCPDTRPTRPSDVGIYGASAA